MDKLKDAILEHTFRAEGKMKLACAQAFVIAETFDGPPSAVAKICSEEDIRICKCQLKCFE